MNLPSESMNETPILQLKNVTKIFNNDLFKKNEVAVNRLSLSFHKGRCTGLLGHNGAGKTTTLRIIFGLVKANEGEVFFQGKSMTRVDRKVIGYMPEVNKISQSVTPEEALLSNLEFYSVNISGKKKGEIIGEMLTTVGLAQHSKKQVKKLSKGMARRLAWAMAVIHDPEVIILDEPYAGLDPAGREEMNEWIHEYKARGKTLILCTHELHSAEQLCDDYHILNNGQLVFSTTEPVDGQVINRDEDTQIFDLHVSGIDRAHLDELQNKSHLPMWNHLDSHSFLQKMSFHQYDHAQNWLQAALTQGLIIVSFQEKSKTNLNELMPYFRRN